MAATKIEEVVETKHRIHRCDLTGLLAISTPNSSFLAPPTAFKQYPSIPPDANHLVRDRNARLGWNTWNTRTPDGSEMQDVGNHHGGKLYQMTQLHSSLVFHSWNRFHHLPSLPPRLTPQVPKLSQLRHLWSQPRWLWMTNEINHELWIMWTPINNQTWMFWTFHSTC
jgi:hypothetical protein